MGVCAMSATASLVVLSSSSSLAASKSPITVALIMSETGVAGPKSGDASQGFSCASRTPVAVASHSAVSTVAPLTLTTSSTRRRTSLSAFKVPTR